MTTSYSSLIDRVRAELEDYGDAVTTLSTAITSASTTSVVLASTKGISAGSFLHMDNECMLVTEVNQTTNAIKVIRGAKGTTADASILSGATCYVNLDYTNLQVWNALNSGLSYSYPKLYVPVEDVASSVTANIYEYTIATAMDHMARVEIENADNTSQYNPDRYWDKVSATKIRLYGDRASGRTIRVVGRNKFTAAAITENLDSNFPDSEDTAVDFLIMYACYRLLMSTQGRVGQLDTFQGATDRFAAGQPYVPINTARQYLEQANTMLNNCKMEPLVEYLPHPMRRMYRRS